MSSIRISRKSRTNHGFSREHMRADSRNLEQTRNVEQTRNLEQMAWQSSNVATLKKCLAYASLGSTNLLNFAQLFSLCSMCMTAPPLGHSRPFSSPTSITSASKSSDVAQQKEQGELHNRPFSPSSHFGPLRHNYERIVPSLKTFSCSTFFTNFLIPLTYEQLEAREGSLGAAYCPDLLDLLP